MKSDTELLHVLIKICIKLIEVQNRGFWLLVSLKNDVNVASFLWTNQSLVMIGFLRIAIQLIFCRLKDVSYNIFLSNKSTKALLEPGYCAKSRYDFLAIVERSF